MPMDSAADRGPDAGSSVEILKGMMDPIRSIYEDDPDMIEIVREFADELPSRAEAVEALLRQADLGELQRLVHQLKGAGGGYGFAAVTEVAAALEQALKDGADAAVLEARASLLCETLRAVEVSKEV